MRSDPGGLSCDKRFAFYFFYLLNFNVTCSNMLSLHSGLTVVIIKRVHFISKCIFLYKPWRKYYLRIHSNPQLMISPQVRSFKTNRPFWMLILFVYCSFGSLNDSVWPVGHQCEQFLSSLWSFRPGKAIKQGILVTYEQRMVG